MSNIKDAITQATRETLKSYLAEELVEQLTEEIIQRAATQMEEALISMAGFEFGRPGAVRSKPAQAPGRKMNKPGKKPKTDNARPATYMTQTSEPGAHNGGGGAEAPMHLS